MDSCDETCATVAVTQETTAWPSVFEEEADGVKNNSHAFSTDAKSAKRLSYLAVSSTGLAVICGTKVSYACIIEEAPVDAVILFKSDNIACDQVLPYFCWYAVS